MQLRYRLSIYIVTAFSVVILIAFGAIYFSFHKLMGNTEIKSLENKTILAALYYLEEDEISIYEHETIKDKLKKSISRKDIAIINSKNIQVKGNMQKDRVISHAFLTEIRKNKQFSLVTENYFYNGIYYSDNEGDFVVIARESKTEFNQQLNTLLVILFIVSTFGIFIIYFISNLLSKYAYEPIVNIVKQLKERDAKNFNTPVKITNSYAEIEDLVKTYNDFIEQLSQLFQIQKNFIDYVSHELKTPITALLGTLEVTLPNSHSKEEIEETTRKMKQYIHDLEQTINNMMLLSGVKVNFEAKIIRIDEIVWKVVENAILYHQAKIDVDIHVQKADELNMNVNAQLLELAINNIIENAIKYSDNQLIKISITSEDSHLILSIEDSGIGIAPTDLTHITQNFFRGENAKNYGGKGIGLSMANIIFKLHHIEMSIQSTESGTTVVLKF